MKKAIKIPLIILSVLLALFLIIAIAFGALYLYSDMVIFDHRDITDIPFYESIDVPSESYSVNYPWFGNPMMLSGGGGKTFTLTLGSGGEKNLRVYSAVNDPIYIWIHYLGERYDGRVSLDYTMEQDSKTISVHLSGAADDDDGSSVPLEQSFIFNIENASPDNLPKWLNEDDLTDEYKEYLNYLLNYETVPMPDWLTEKLAER